MSYTACSHEKGSRKGAKPVTGSSSATKAGLSKTPKSRGGTSV
jgi:hypothetical protein